MFMKQLCILAYCHIVLSFDFFVGICKPFSSEAVAHHTELLNGTDPSRISVRA